MSPDLLTATLVDLLDGKLDALVGTLSDWARILPGRRRGRGMSPRVLLKWHIAGTRGHRLKTHRAGQRHVVIGRDLRLHLEAIAPRASRPPTPSSSQAPARRQEKRAALAKRMAEAALR